MPTYTFFIDGTQHEWMDITTTEIHPSADPDTWSVLLPENVDVADGVEIEIKRDGTTHFKGVLEERTLEMSGKIGVTMRVGGRQTKVKVWRNWIERNSDPKSGGFWENYYPHKIVQFYLYPSKSDVSTFHRHGWGIDPADDWVVTTNPAGSGKNYVKDRFITYGWDSGANQADGHYVAVDLGSAKTICAIRIENRINDDYPENYKIQYSATGVWGGEEVDVATETNNTANNVVHAWTPVSARYWRIRLTAVADPSKEWWVGEIYLYETDGTMSGISEGTLEPHVKLDEALDFEWMRRSDIIQKVTDLTETGDVPWEWWVTDDGVTNFASRRGSDKSASMAFEYRSDLVSTSYKRESRQKVQRLKILGLGKGHKQDLVASDWVGTGDYEKVLGFKELKNQEACTAKANVLVNELQYGVTTIRCEVDDVYATGSWGVGDDVTLTDVTTGISGSYRVKKIVRKVGVDGEVVILEASDARKTIVDKIAGLYNEFEALKMKQDESRTISYSQVDDSFLMDLRIHNYTFTEEFCYFETALWDLNGDGGETAAVTTVNNFPALRLRSSAGAGVRFANIKTGAEWSGAVWRYITKLKVDAVSVDDFPSWGMGDDGLNWIRFIYNYGDDQKLHCHCQDGAGDVNITNVTLDNFPDLTEWHIYRVDWESGVSVKFYIDGLLVATITTHVPATAMSYWYQVYNDNATQRAMDIRGCAGQMGLEED